MSLADSQWSSSAGRATWPTSSCPSVTSTAASSSTAGATGVQDDDRIGRRRAGVWQRRTSPSSCASTPSCSARPPGQLMAVMFDERIQRSREFDADADGVLDVERPGAAQQAARPTRPASRLRQHAQRPASTRTATPSSPARPAAVPPRQPARHRGPRTAARRASSSGCSST